MTKLIQLNEALRLNDDGVVETQPALANVEGIVSVQKTELQRDGQSRFLIGQTEPATISIVSLTSGGKLFVKESVAEVAALVAAA